MNAFVESSIKPTTYMGIRLCLLILLLLIIPVDSFAQKQCFNYKGQWSSWSSISGNIYHYADESGIILKTNGLQEYFRFQISNYKPPTKKELKQHIKSGEWFEYEGIVEYYVNDTYPTAEDISKSCYFVMPNPRVDITPTIKRSTKCIIRIAPYKKLPACYNVLFDEIGVGIDIHGVSFENEKKHVRKGRVVANIIQSIFLFPIGIGSWWWNPIYKKR